MDASCSGVVLLLERLVHFIDGIMRKEHYVGILKRHLKTSATNLKLGYEWVFKNRCVSASSHLNEEVIQSFISGVLDSPEGWFCCRAKAFDSKSLTP